MEVGSVSLVWLSSQPELTAARRRLRVHAKTTYHNAGSILS